MVLEIALGAGSILLLSSLYVNWNLLKKTELLETWIEETSEMVQNTYGELQKIDSTGHFESDDEIGSVFEGIKLTIENLNDYVNGENING
jgi:hypothetical protein